MPTRAMYQTQKSLYHFKRYLRSLKRDLLRLAQRSKREREHNYQVLAKNRPQGKAALAHDSSDDDLLADGAFRV